MPTAPLTSLALASRATRRILSNTKKQMSPFASTPYQVSLATRDGSLSLFQDSSISICAVSCSFCFCLLLCTFQSCAFLATVIAEIFVRVKISYSSVGRLSYARNFRTATVVSDALVYVYSFRMLLNFVLSAKSTKCTKLNRE